MGEIHRLGEYKWPEQECLHRNSTHQEHIMSMQGLAQAIPAHCWDCGHDAPIDEALFPVWDEEEE